MSKVCPHRSLAPGILLGCLLLFSAGLVQAKSLEAYFKGVTGLRAGFTQKLFNPRQELEETTHGLIVVQSPDKFRLEYTTPYKQIYVADGKNLWTYDEDLEQATVKPQDNVLSNTPAMVLSNPDKLTTSYVVKPLGSKDGLEWFALTPKDKDTNFELLRLGFAKDRLHTMELIDSFGQTTQLVFSDLQRNPDLAKDAFRFSPPPGVDVIGE